MMECLFFFKRSLWVILLIVLMASDRVCAQVQDYYDLIYEQIEENEGLPQQRIYLNAYLQRAKSERNYDEIVNGYRLFSYYRPEKEALQYGDSMVWISERSGNSLLKADAYLSKGILYYKYKKYKPALDLYLKSLSHLEKTDDEYLYFKILYNLAQVKNYLGYYEEAIAHYKDCIEYFRKENKRGYLNSLHALALCYSRLGDFAQSNEVIALGKAESEKLSINMEAYFNLLLGINSSYLNDYHTAIRLIGESMRVMESSRDFAQIAMGNFYLGKSHWVLDKREKAVGFFRKVDEIFERHNYIQPQLREAYYYLGQYYQEMGNTDSVNYHLSQLSKANWHYEKEYLILTPKILKEYDFAQSQKENYALKDSLQKKEKEKWCFLAGIGSFLIISVLAFVYRGKIRKEKLQIKSERKTRSIELNDSVLSNLGNQLSKFEQSGKFLKKDWTQAQLASEFGSNVAYLKEAIKKLKNKTFSAYINDLRIEYLLDLLEKDRKIRHYDNKSLAKEVGFSSTSRFTKAFQSRTGMRPGEYMEHLRLRKEIEGH
ncbi:tetratricopeptide repeat protein [Moheibacter sp.]|uniref:tetratricopeptide repeat protein n=1 Tax=Moheibacter sp. TaxID=1965316 RepID=UPI003C71B79C